jgi:uncharacterized membrane protein YphA (DoxX/SURF4 family)
MKNHGQLAQLILRIALGIGFLTPVLDRLGYLGAAGEPNIAWGNYAAFLSYVHVLLPWMPSAVSDVFGWIASASETILGVLLILGYKTRLAAFGSFILTMCFVISMSAAIGFKAALIIRYRLILPGHCCFQQCPAICGAWTDSLPNQYPRPLNKVYKY